MADKTTTTKGRPASSVVLRNEARAIVVGILADTLLDLLLAAPDTTLSTGPKALDYLAEQRPPAPRRDDPDAARQSIHGDGGAR